MHPPSSLKIGPYQLDSNLLLAPMAGITDRPFRGICRSFGAGLAISEMVASDPALRNHRRTLLKADQNGECEPRSVQIVGADPQMMAAAARHNVARGAQIIDINMGCPAKKVCGGRVPAGSALMRDEALVKQIVSAVVEAVEQPVTLKIRTGWDSDNRNAVEIARIAEQAGIQALTVHGRTRACRFSGQAEYQTIAMVKSAVSIPVIANGDIDSAAKARDVLQQTAADAIMIGRGAQGRPWLFRQIEHFLRTGNHQPEPDDTTIRQVIDDHLQQLHQFYGETMGVRIARKHIRWYLDHRVGGEEGMFRRIVRAEQPEQQRRLVQIAIEQSQQRSTVNH